LLCARHGVCTYMSENARAAEGFHLPLKVAWLGAQLVDSHACHCCRPNKFCASGRKWRKNIIPNGQWSRTGRQVGMSVDGNHTENNKLNQKQTHADSSATGIVFPLTNALRLSSMASFDGSLKQSRQSAKTTIVKMSRAPPG